MVDSAMSCGDVVYAIAFVSLYPFSDVTQGFFTPADDDLTRVRVGLFSKPSWHSPKLVLKN